MSRFGDLLNRGEAPAAAAPTPPAPVAAPTPVAKAVAPKKPEAPKEPKVFETDKGED